MRRRSVRISLPPCRLIFPSELLMLRISSPKKGWTEAQHTFASSNLSKFKSLVEQFNDPSSVPANTPPLTPEFITEIERLTTYVNDRGNGRVRSFGQSPSLSQSRGTKLTAFLLLSCTSRSAQGAPRRNPCDQAHPRRRFRGPRRIFRGRGRRLSSQHWRTNEGGGGG